MSIYNNTIRNGNFTSSEIAALTTKDKSGKSWGKPAWNYIAETNMERRLGRPLADESKARPLTWGKLLEPFGFSKKGFEYELCSQNTIQHPTIPYWTGSPDGTAPDTVIDIKCPMTLKSFCTLVQPIYDNLTGMDAMNIIRSTHQDGEKYYWQLVSNSILTNSKFAELVVYMPYESELPEIKNLADGNPECYWIWSAMDNELPFLVDGGYYQNINTIRFEVPQKDKEYLTDCVQRAGQLLINSSSVIIAHHDPEANVTIVEPDINLSILKKI